MMPSQQISLSACELNECKSAVIGYIGNVTSPALAYCQVILWRKCVKTSPWRIEFLGVHYLRVNLAMTRLRRVRQKKTYVSS